MACISTSVKVVIYHNQFVFKVVDVLRDALIKQITVINETEDETQKTKKLSEMLDKSFPVIKNKKLQPIAMHIMKFLPKIKPKYLTQVILKCFNVCLVCSNINISVLYSFVMNLFT